MIISEFISFQSTYLKWCLFFDYNVILNVHNFMIAIFNRTQITVFNLTFVFIPFIKKEAFISLSNVNQRTLRIIWNLLIDKELFSKCMFAIIIFFFKKNIFLACFNYNIVSNKLNWLNTWQRLWINHTEITQFNQIT